MVFGIEKDEVIKWLRGMKPEARTCFKHKMKIYAPTGYGRCQATVDELIKDVNIIFQGCTVYDAKGNWYDKKARAVETEPIKVIEIGHDCLKGQQARELVKAMTKYAVKCNQQAMSIVDGDFYIAESPEMVRTAEKKFGIRGTRTRRR